MDWLGTFVEKVNNNKVGYIRVIGVIATSALFLYLIDSQGWPEILEAIQQIQWIYLIFAFAAVMLSRFAVIARWYMLLSATAVNISWVDALRITFAGLFATNFLPTSIGGDIVRIGAASRQEHNGAVMVASIVVDRVIGMSGMLLIFLVGGIIYLKEWIMIDTPFSFSAAGIFYKNKMLKKLWQKIHAGILRVFQSFSHWTKNPRAILLSFCMTILHMVFLFSALYLLVLGMGDNLSFWFIGTLWSLVYFVTLLPISINGYGLQEVSLTFVLSNIGAISLQHSLVIALLIRTLFIVASLPGAIFLPNIVVKNNQEIN